MYHKMLQILIVSQDSDLDEILRKVEPQPGYSHEFLPVQPDLSQFVGAEADIILLDLPLSDIPSDIRARCGKTGAQLIYIDRESVCDQALVESGLLEEFAAIWSAPLSETRLLFQFKRILQEVQQRWELWLQEHLLDTLIDSVPDLIWLKDTKGVHQKVNAAFCSLVGKTKEDCQGRGHYYIWNMDPEEYSKGEYVCLESEEEVMQARETRVFDEQIKGPEQRMMQFRTYKSPVLDEDGTLLGTLGVAHDVTDWKNQGTELEVMLETLRSAAMVVGASGNIFMANSLLCDFFGQQKEAVLGQPYVEWKQAVFHTIRRAAPGETVEFLYESPKGKFIVEMEEEPIFDMFHQQLGYFCVFRDITERRKHQALSVNYQKQLESDVRLKTRTIKDIQKRVYIALADIINSRDHATGDHLRNTSLFVDILLEELKREARHKEMADEDYCEAVSRAVPLHDIGKLGLPDAVLYKPGKYTPEEYQIMTTHVTIGARIVEQTMIHIESFKFYRIALDMVASHHERWDGQGYPKGLKEKEIPLAARILSVADVFDALISPRPYNATMSIDQAYTIIKAGAGSQFDPEVAAAFIMARPAVERAVQAKVYGVK